VAIVAVAAGGAGGAVPANGAGVGTGALTAIGVTPDGRNTAPGTGCGVVAPGVIGVAAGAGVGTGAPVGVVAGGAVTAAVKWASIAWINGSAADDSRYAIKFFKRILNNFIMVVLDLCFPGYAYILLYKPVMRL
jgi:hypothetical protein